MEEHAITIREYIDQQIDSIRRDIVAASEGLRREISGVEKGTQLAHAAAQRAVDKAEEAMSRKLEVMNEFRATLGDQAATFATRTQLEDKFNSIQQVQRTEVNGLTAQIENNRNITNDMMQRFANYDGRMWALGLVIVVIQIAVSYLMKGS